MVNCNWKCVPVTIVGQDLFYPRLHLWHHNIAWEHVLPLTAPLERYCVNSLCVRTCSHSHMCVIMFVHMCQNVLSHIRPFLPSPAPVTSQCVRTCSPSKQIEWLNAAYTSERRRCVRSSCVRICSPIYENMFSYTLHLWEDIVWPFNAWERVLPHKNFVALTCVMWCDAMYILSPNVHTLKVCRHTPHEVKYG